MKRFLFLAAVGYLARLMPAAPSVGSDTNVWGTELNNFLGSHADLTTGALLDSALGHLNFNVQTASYTLQKADSGKLVSLNGASSMNLTIPTDANMTGGAMAVGDTVLVRQGAGGSIAFVAATGVSLNSRGGLTHTAGQYAYATLLKVAANQWEIFGDLA